MRIISCSLQNFASYKSLNFNFLNQGLSLIQGPTGSGKSTLCDAIPWLLFGRTAKNGAVDEVLSWPGDQITRGALHLEFRDQAIVIKRSRGPKAKDNDLYYLDIGGEVVRGKDIPDTQKLINNLIGLDCELYLAGAYYHEFSQTAQFFTTTAKNRRSICEQIVDLSLAIKLQESSQAEWKSTNSKLGGVEDKIQEYQHRLSYAETTMKFGLQRIEEWYSARSEKIKRLKAQYDSFEENNIQELKKYKLAEEEFLKKAEADPVCSECGALKAKDKKHTIHNPFSAKIDAVLSRSNAYLVDQITQLESEINPHIEANTLAQTEASKALESLEKLNADKDLLLVKKEDLELLQQIVADFRSISIQNTIKDIEAKTNSFLSTFFDSEIKVEFEIASADKLEVLIHKDGNLCAYTQLSKGQRQLLKLCFGVSIMQAVTNHHGISFNVAFFDEALDGLDDSFKTKAFRLLETIAQQYESIFVVEHSSELKERFINKFEVELVDGHSRIEKI